ncbi:MAG TPA: hypothetical protein VIV60_25180 [Polyangiaceae bacterium]
MIDGRNTLATILQSSTVQLFGAFDIAVAPVTAKNRVPADVDRLLSAAANFSSPAMTGSLAIFLPHDIYMVARHPTQRPYEPRDWTRELCNQLLGRIKNRLHGCGIELRTGLPTAVTGTLLERHRSDVPPDAVFGFRTLRGTVTTTLTGNIDYSRIQYTGQNCTAAEGDVILF